MKYNVFIIFILLPQLIYAQDCDSLSLEIKEYQLAYFHEAYSKTINDCYNRRNITGILKELCSHSQVGDTLFILEFHDRVLYAANYASLWNSRKPKEIFSYEFYLNGNREEISYDRGTEFSPAMLMACHKWDIDYLKRKGLEHIKHWTSRCEVLLTRVVKGPANVTIDCAVFYNFY